MFHKLINHIMKIIGNRSRCFTVEQLRLRMKNKLYPVQFCSVVGRSGIVVYLGLRVLRPVQDLDDFDDDDELFLPQYHSRPLSREVYDSLAAFADEVGCTRF